jgi:hypothetical protein
MRPISLDLPTKFNQLAADLAAFMVEELQMAGICLRQ